MFLLTIQSDPMKVPCKTLTVGFSYMLILFLADFYSIFSGNHDYAGFSEGLPRKSFGDFWNGNFYGPDALPDAQLRV